MPTRKQIAMAFALFLTLAMFAPLTPAQQSTTKPVSAVPAKKIVSFTLVTENYLYDSSGKRRLNSRRVVARRSDGATVTLDFPPQDNETPRIRTISFLDGHFLEVYDHIHAFVNWPATCERTALQLDLVAMHNNCLGQDTGQYLDEYTTLGGVKVAVLRSLPKGSSGNTFWLAPELACQDLQQTYTQVKADGSFRLVSEEKFVSLKLGEPDAALFNVPSTYASLTPSAALRQQCEKTGHPWNSRAQEVAARMDTAYARRLKESQSSSH